MPELKLINLATGEERIVTGDSPVVAVIEAWCEEHDPTYSATSVPLSYGAISVTCGDWTTKANPNWTVADMSARLGIGSEDCA